MQTQFHIHFKGRIDWALEEESPEERIAVLMKEKDDIRRILEKLESDISEITVMDADDTPIYQCDGDFFGGEFYWKELDRRKEWIETQRNEVAL